ncbi:hypothetical protein L210DRAFT_3551980, partial [Boletus edulis BED1]
TRIDEADQRHESHLLHAIGRGSRFISPVNSSRDHARVKITHSDDINGSNACCPCFSLRASNGNR